MAGESAPKIKRAAAWVYDGVPVIGKYSWSRLSFLNRIASAYYNESRKRVKIKSIPYPGTSHAASRGINANLLNNRQHIGLQFICAKGTYTHINLVGISISLILSSQVEDDIWRCLRNTIEGWNIVWCCIQANDIVNNQYGWLALSYTWWIKKNRYSLVMVVCICVVLDRSDKRYV